MHKEPDAPDSPDIAAELNDAIRRLGRFLGAERVQYGQQLPAPWSASLQNGPC
jgi:hypothetical protein